MVAGYSYFLFFFAIFLTLTILLVWPVFPYIVLAVLLTYLLHPLNERLRRTIKSNDLRATLLTLFALVAIALPIVYAAQKVTREIGSAIQLRGGSQKLLENATVWLAKHEAEMVADWILEAIQQARQFVVGSIPSLFGSVLNIVLGIFVCLFVFYYFSREGSMIWEKFLNILPLPAKLKSDVSTEITGILRAIFYGQLLTALVQGSIGGIGLWIFQVPQPFFWTVVMILVAFFPVIGTPFIWGPAVVLKFVSGDPTWQWLGLLIYGGGVVMNIDNFLRPRLIAQHSRIHPVVILIGIIGGTKVFGFVGFLVGPIIFGIFLQLLRFFAEYRQAEAQASAEDRPAEAQPVSPAV